MRESFYSQHPVFTADEFQDFLRHRGAMSPSTRKTLLAQREKAGDLVRVRRGLYAVVPVGATPETAQVDPYLLAARIGAGRSPRLPHRPGVPRQGPLGIRGLSLLDQRSIPGSDIPVLPF